MCHHFFIESTKKLIRPKLKNKWLLPKYLLVELWQWVGTLNTATTTTTTNLLVELWQCELELWTQLQLIKHWNKTDISSREGGQGGTAYIWVRVFVVFWKNVQGIFGIMKKKLRVFLLPLVFWNTVEGVFVFLNTIEGIFVWYIELKLRVFLYFAIKLTVFWVIFVFWKEVDGIQNFSRKTWHD